jgi:beta-lactamase regulating signal transducer with metallopeptidase domain
VIPTGTSSEMVQQAQTPESSTGLMLNPNTFNSRQSQPQANTGWQIQSASSTITENTMTARQTISLSTEEILLAVWLTDAVIGFLYLVVLYGVLRRRIHNNAQLPSKHLLKLFDEVKTELNIKRDVKIIGQCEYGTPAILFPNIVLIPVGTVVSMSDVEVKFILRHELMHFKRYDHIIGLLISLLNAIYWFNPIVWLAFKQIHADMETACDSDVVRHLSGKEKTAYAALILSLFSRKQYGNLALGMARGNNRQIAERRIRGIYINHKTNKKVKITAILLTALLLFTCFTTACQPTPDEAAVVNKGDGELEEKLGQTNTALSGQYQAPDTYQTSFSEYSGRLKVQVDAIVKVPGVKSYPVVTFEHKPFSQEQVNTMVDVLMNGAPMYEKSATPTKDELNQQLINMRKEYEDLKNGIDNTDGNQTIEDYKVMIKELEAKIANTPDKVERKIIRSDYYSQNDHILAADANAGREQTAHLRINEEKMDFRIGDGYYWDGSCAEANKLNLSVTKEQAIEQAKQLIKKLDADYMEPVVVMRAVKDMGETDTNDEAYYILFTRSYKDIPTTYAGYDSMNNDYNKAISLEQISVIINDEGIVSVTWKGNGSVQNTLNENIELLSFEEAMERFAKQIAVENSYIVEDDEENFTQSKVLYIKKITLGYMEIQKKDNNTNILIPTWNFFGFYTTEYDAEKARKLWQLDGATDVEIEGRLQDHENNNLEFVANGIWSLRSMLSINAVDGSIIDISKCY